MRLAHRLGKRNFLWLLVFLAATIRFAKAQTDAAAAPAPTQPRARQTEQPQQPQRPEQQPNVTSEEDLKKEEKQRILAIVPNFNVSYNFSSPAACR
jgi:hypothetical protein